MTTIRDAIQADMSGGGVLPRSKTVLNGSGAILVAGAGVPFALVTAADGSARAPERVQVFPAGQWFRKWRYDMASDRPVEDQIQTTRAWLEEIAANTRDAWGDNPLPLFDDHWPSGPVKGNFRAGEIEVDDEGLWIRPSWTAAARAEIERGEWLYVSGGWRMSWVDRATGQETQRPVLMEVSRTNQPYFLKQKGLAADGGDGNTVLGMVPIAAQTAGAPPAQTQEDQMDRNKLIEALGLTADASDEDVMAAVTGLKTKAEAKAETETPAPQTVEPKDSAVEKFNPQGMGAAAAELMADAAVAAGKVAPDQKQLTAKALSGMSVADAKEFIAGLGKIVPAGKEPLADKAKGDDSATASIDPEIMKACGLTADQVAKHGQ